MVQSKDECIPFIEGVLPTHNSENSYKEAISETDILLVLKWSVTTHKIIMLYELHGIKVEK